MKTEEIKETKRSKPAAKKARKTRKSKGNSGSNNSKKLKSDKKLVALSRKVLICLKNRKESTGTEIAYQIMEILAKEESKKLDFKNVQRRVYDALNVFSALNIIKKEKNKVSITDHGLEYLKRDGSTIPIKLQPVCNPAKPDVIKAAKSCELKDLQAKVDQKKQALQQRRDLIKEKTLQTVLLKKLLVKNCSEQFNILTDAKKVRLPFILCKLDKGSDFDISIGDDNQSVMISSETIPSLYNENHVLEELHNSKQGLEESEIEELLGSTRYNQIKTALDKNKITKYLLSKRTEVKIQHPKRDLTKKTKEELLLQCKEKIILDPSDDSPVRTCQPKMLKRERKAMRKRFLSPNFDKENRSITSMSEAKEENAHSRKGGISQFATPIKEELGRVSILDKMLYKNHFDSYDSRSPINMSVFEEKDYHGITPVRFLGSSYKISPEEYELEIGGDIKLGPNEISPYHDRFKNIWRSCIENDDRNPSFGLNQHPKGFRKVITKRTPCKDFSNLNENYSPINENCLLSPTKDHGMLRGMAASPFLVKSPLLKAFPGLSKVITSHRDVYDDDITKAEHSNLFSSKSNQLQ